MIPRVNQLYVSKGKGLSKLTVRIVVVSTLYNVLVFRIEEGPLSDPLGSRPNAPERTPYRIWRIDEFVQEYELREDKVYALLNDEGMFETGWGSERDGYSDGYTQLCWNKATGVITVAD